MKTTEPGYWTAAELVDRAEAAMREWEAMKAAMREETDD